MDQLQFFCSFIVIELQNIKFIYKRFWEVKMFNFI